ncbi:MAG TPA: MFS transporter [Jatrophihabitans sp.]|jgi:MFS family permease
MTTFAAVTTLRTTAARPAVRGWVIAATVYFLAVFHRSSLGVAGLLAEQRFGISAAQLGAFVLLQIGVYAAMQVPTGVLVDRYGPRRLLIVAAGLMAFGQLLFAIAPSYPLALVARGLLGCGDAMTFISVLRYAAGKFSARRYPVLLAITGTVGTVGNLLATLPLEQLLEHVGWAPSFLVAGSLSAVTGAVVWALLDDGAAAPARLRRAHEVRAGIVSVSKRVHTAWRLPGTKLGFWVHFSSMTIATALGVLWGEPYLVDGVGFTQSQAGAVLMACVLVSGIAGPMVGWFIGGHPHLRITLVLSQCAATLIGWLSVVFVFGANPPHLFVAVLFALTMTGGPVSTVAFAVARDYNSSRIIGTASGVVNVGGFLAAAIVSITFGQLLTMLGGSSPEHLRIALLVPIAVEAFGTWRVFVWVRRLRAILAKRQRGGEAVPVRVNRHFFWDAHWNPQNRPDYESLAG